MEGDISGSRRWPQLVLSEVLAWGNGCVIMTDGMFELMAEEIGVLMA